MGQRNTLDQQREYNRAAEQRRRQAGYHRRTLIVHESDWPAVKRLADRLRQQREKTP